MKDQPPQSPVQAPVPTPAPRHDETALARATTSLRTWGLRQPVILSLTATLPPLSSLAPGGDALAWEAQAVPGIGHSGFARVSLLRVVSRTPDGDRLVGQVQALGPLDHPGAAPSLAFYLHEPRRGSTRRANAPDAWFTQLLDLHYAGGGSTVDLDPMPGPAPL